MKNLTIVVFLLLMLLMACSSAPKQNTAFYVQKIYERVYKGTLTKYDDFFEKANQVTEKISAVESNLQNFPFIISELVTDAKIIGLMMNNDKIDDDAIATEKLVMNTHMETLKDNPSKILKVLMKTLNENGMRLKISSLSQDKATGEIIIPTNKQTNEIMEKANEFNEKLEKLLTSLYSIAKDSEAIVIDTKKLIKQGKTLAQSAKSDFTGMNAMKLPGLLKELASTSKNLVKVPVQIKNIVVLAPKIIISFKETLK